MPSLSTIILGLAVTAFAIDIRLPCDASGAHGACVNANPDHCCGVPSGVFDSVGFYAIPKDWYIEVRGYEGGNCGNEKTSDTNYGGDTKCLTQGPYTGGSYSFRSAKKRSTGCAEGQCKGWQRINTFVAEDGKKFSLVDLSDDEVVDIMESGMNGTVPEKYHKYEIAE